MPRLHVVVALLKGVVCSAWRGGACASQRGATAAEETLPKIVERERMTFKHQL
jgi:hypothetical protein